MKYLLPLTLLACSEYNLNAKGGSNHGGENGSGFTSDSNFESFTDGLTEEEEELNDNTTVIAQFLDQTRIPFPSKAESKSKFNRELEEMRQKIVLRLLMNYPK